MKGALLMVRSCSDSGNESPKTLSTTSQINDIRRSSLLHVDNILSEDVVGRGGDPLHQIGGDPLHVQISCQLRHVSINEFYIRWHTPRRRWWTRSRSGKHRSRKATDSRTRCHWLSNSLPLTLELANRIDALLTQDAIFSQKISHPVEPPLKRCLLK